MAFHKLTSNEVAQEENKNKAKVLQLAEAPLRQSWLCVSVQWRSAALLGSMYDDGHQLKQKVLSGTLFSQTFGSDSRVKVTTVCIHCDSAVKLCMSCCHFDSNIFS